MELHIAKNSPQTGNTDLHKKKMDKSNFHNFFKNQAVDALVWNFGDLDIEPFSITWQNLLSPHGLLTTRQFWKMTLQNEKNGQWEQYKKKFEKQPIVESKWNCQVLLTVVSSTTREDFRSPHRPAIKWHFRQTHLHKKEKRGNKSNLNIFFQNQSVDSLELNFRNL